MAKINYSKAEQEINEAIQKMKAKKLLEGKTITSRQAARYYGLEENEPRPIPQDPVTQLLSEEAAKIEETSQHIQTFVESQINEEENEEQEIISDIDTILSAKPQSVRAPKKEQYELPEVSSSDKLQEPIKPLSILRKYILWFKRLHIKQRYELLGTTKEEIAIFRRARRLTIEQQSRIQELIKRAQKLHEDLLKKENTQSDDSLILEQKKAHKNKRFNVKKTWLPL